MTRRNPEISVVEQLARQEVAERVAFERGKQEALAGHSMDRDEASDLVEDLRYAVDSPNAWAPLADAATRGFEYGAALREADLSGGD